MKPGDLAAVVLAGGFGTRLASVVADRPKPMASVCGRPFLEHLLDYLQAQSVTRAVLAIGYKGDMIHGHFGDRYRAVDLAYSVEAQPLGTGGGLRQAFAQQSLELALVLNGDTYCDADLARLAATHAASGLGATLALVEVPNAARYGAVDLDDASRITAFREKDPAPRPGLINAGIYLMERSLLDTAPAAACFSLEKDVLQPGAAGGRLAGCPMQATFIDIGTPEDYQRAQTLLAGPRP